MKTLPLDRIFSIGTTYETSSRTCYVFEKLGTGVSDDVKVVIDGKECGLFHGDLAPKHKINTNLFGPVCLKELVYVVPPETKFEFRSATAGEVRAIGRLLLLEPDEAVPPELMDRFKAQNNHYITKDEKTYSHGTDVALAAGAEVEIYKKKLETNEKFTLNHIVAAKITNATGYAQGQIGIRFYLDGVPLDTLQTAEGDFGIDSYSMPLPPTETTEFQPFTLERFPLVVEGDHELRITAINVKGTAISPPTGTAITIRVAFVHEYQRFI